MKRRQCVCGCARDDTAWKGCTDYANLPTDLLTYTSVSLLQTTTEEATYVVHTGSTLDVRTKLKHCFSTM